MGKQMGFIPEASQSVALHEPALDPRFSYRGENVVQTLNRQ
jgi:hypothetical protein